MDRIKYSKEKMSLIKGKVQKMIEIVTELENEFPGRHFTLDGHLVGSIGEVMAAYYYGIELYKASAVVHDGCVGKREVQIKITQQDDIVINEEPQYLLVLYLTKKGDVYEVYNGPGSIAWYAAGNPDRHGYRHLSINKLMQLDGEIAQNERISIINSINKLTK